MIIRKAKLKDVPIIVDLWKEFMKYHDEILIKKNKQIKPHLIKKKNAPRIFRKFVRKNILSKNSIVFIVEVGGKPVGYSLNYIKNNIPIFNVGKIGYICDLFVKKEFRGQRMSTKLKNEAINWFKKKSIKYVSITVHNYNEHAHSIYKKWGFFDFHVEMRKKI